MKNVKIFVLSVLMLCLSATLFSQSHRYMGLRDNTPQVYALTHARIVAQPGRVYENATLVIRDGIIEAVGTRVAIPQDAWVINMEGKTIYPGFIETYSVLGMHSAEEMAEWIKLNPAEAKHWNPQVRSHFSGATSYRYKESDVAALRSQGFVAAHTLPVAGVFRGSGVVVKLLDKVPSKQLILSDNSQGIAYTSTRELGRDYPTSAMGALSLLRQSFIDARYLSAAAANPPVLQKDHSPALKALANAMENNTPFVAEVDDEEWIARLAGIAEEFSLNLWIKGSGHEYRRPEIIRNAGAKLIIPLNFPEAPEVLRPEQSLNVSLEDLRHWQLAPANAAALEAANIAFAISAFGLKKPENFLPNLRKAVERGLSEERALAALTTIPAEMLGINTKYGALQPGMAASFLVCDGNIFRENTQIQEVWVEGVKHKTDKEVLAGEWAVNGLPNMENIRLIITTSKNRTEVQVKANDNQWTKKAENVKWENNRLSFRLKKDSINDGMRLSASLFKEQMTGIAETDQGELFNWTASLLNDAPTEAKTKTEEIASEALILPVLFPSMEYGFEVLPQVTPVILVQNATIWTQGPEGILENADMLVRNGKIAAIGKGLNAPAGAYIIDATGRHLTPGLIDPHLHTSIAGGVNETGDAITSETRIMDVIEANNVWIYRLLAGGLTTANLFHGSANPIGGQSALIKMRWGATAHELVYNEGMPGLKFALGENVKRMENRYPNTRMGAEQIIRDAFLAALQYDKEKQANLSLRRRDQKPFRTDLQLEPILEVLQGKRLAHVHAYRQDEMLMMMRLAEEFGFTVASFEHTVEGYKIADEMREHGAAAIVWTDWSSFKVEAYDAIHQNARLLIDAGVLTSLHSDNTQLATRMNWEAGKILKSGVDEVTAMDLITMNPARILKIDHRVGSLETGKEADFVIWNGHPLSAFTTADQTWIEGRKLFDREQDKELQETVRQQRILIINEILSK